MKRINFVCKFMAILVFILIGCQGDGGLKYHPPQDCRRCNNDQGGSGGVDATVGGSFSSTTMTNDSTSAGGSECLTSQYDILCEETGGKLLVSFCCQYMHPYHVDTCKGEEQCPPGGVTCIGVSYCDCGVDNCFSSENGCQPIQ